MPCFAECALLSGEQLLHDGVEHHCHNWLEVGHQSDAHTHEGKAVHKVGGACKRIAPLTAAALPGT